MAHASHGRARQGFVIRRLDGLVPPSQGRDWDVRFVSATLLFYGMVAAAFFLVEWLNPPASDAPVEVATPSDQHEERMGTPRHVRFPQRLNDRDAADMPSESP